MALFIEKFFALSALLIGLSHLLRPKQWTALLVELKQNRHFAFYLALFYLPWSLLVICGHNVWVWDVPVLVTAYGWLLTIKSALYLLFPELPRRIIPDEARLPRGFVIAGLVMVVAGLILGWQAWLR
ncbi:MAG: hypothetical protein HY300_18250 [Verrucomicrobia bacterium]|nr:hypothetical protein [Verrucomicrobiota bacterium]